MATVTAKSKTRVIKQNVERKSIWRRIFSPITLSIFAVFLLICGSVFAYFYMTYSKMIDARLRGDILIRTTGIYAAPRSIRDGQTSWSLATLKAYLDALGYVDASKEADSKRGRYTIKGNTLEIRTSSDAIVNSVRQFPNLAVTFNAKGVDKIVDLDSKKMLNSALLEPEQLTAISNEKEKQKQKLVSYKDLPKNYVNAVVAIEDRQFFEHSGINIRGIFRALLRNVSEGETQQGGSSVTQQLVKNFFLTPERTLKRKMQEMMIAVVLETKLSKEEIFQLYANEIFMGQNGNYSINGVGEAAAVYFNKDVVNLSLPECAFLAGIIRGPSLYSPYRDPERAKARRNQVLDSMVEAQFITREEADKAKATELKIESKKKALNSDAPYFLDYLQQQMASEMATHDAARESYRVYTTIDMDLQRAADKALTDTLAQLDPLFSKRKKNPVAPGTLQAALVAMNAKTGEILALSGGRDYSASQLNRAVDANRQPGSVFKPIVYAAALNTAFEKGDDEAITPATVFLDEPKTFLYGGSKTYDPGNFDDKYSNKNVTVRDALVHSLNVVTVEIAEKVGYNKVTQMAQKLGLPRPQALPSTALGAAEATPLQVAQAYTAFANNGTLTDAVALKRVTNSTGTTVSEIKAQKQQALRPEVAWLMTNIMQDVLNRGTASRARAMGFNALAAGKTGTSRDGWFAGYTPNLVCVVWVGFDDNSELGLEGAKSALPIWAAFMKQALAIRPELGGNEFPKPDGITSAEIDPTSGLLADQAVCPVHRTEYFIAGTEPKETCGGQATGETPAEGQPKEPGDAEPPEKPADRRPVEPPSTNRRPPERPSADHTPGDRRPAERRPAPVNDPLGNMKRMMRERQEGRKP
ncbi:MAG: PBP1A family penicillin-binding protein [Acidobacteria bacterium]|nr:PBP1A family penicillin-binding protein [Acidobacteriota bacterium]